MQGTIVKVAVEEGQAVAEGDVVVVLEAMKMEQPLKAHKAGTVTGLKAEVGATVSQRRGHLRAQGLSFPATGFPMRFGPNPQEMRSPMCGLRPIDGGRRPSVAGGEG